MKKLLPYVLVALMGAVVIVGPANAGVVEDTIDGMTEEELESKTPSGENSKLPTLDEAKVREIVQHLLEVEKWNGWTGIARKLKVARGQVKAIDAERKKKLEELKKEAEPIP